MPQSPVADEVRTLSDLVARLRRSPGFADVEHALLHGDSGTIDGAWGSCCALTAAAIAQAAASSQADVASGGPPSAGRTLLVVVPRIADIDDMAADLASLLPAPPLVFPAWESLPQDRSVADQVFGLRLRVLQELESAAPPTVVVAPFPALLQPVPGRRERAAGTRLLRVGDEIDLDGFLRWLVERGFERTSAIERPGEFSVHGGIIDVFPPDAVDPLRLELFGDEIESIRRFDVESQRKVDDLHETRLTIIAPGAIAPSAKAPGAGDTASDRHEDVDDSGHIIDSLPAGSWIVLAEPEELVEEGRHYLERLENPRGLFGVAATIAHCTARPTVTVAALSGTSTEATCHLQVESIEKFSGPKSEVIQELAGVVGRDESVLIACHNEGERERLSELLAESAPTLAPRVRLCLGAVSHGFRLVAERIIVLSDHELFNRVEVRRVARKKRIESRAIDTFLDLNEGDLVVHLTHGIGRYRGMELLDSDGVREEHLSLEFRDGVRVFVPASLIHLVQKYIGAAKGVPRLSKLGGQMWSRQKSRVTEAVTDMAADMLRLHAERESKPGIACDEDTHLQQEFESSFPYVETADQVKAIADCRGDLERGRPMDRLICGDVGFGKTEVAMRAAFKMIDNGRQVAVLVPTTVLAEQHYRTFCDRMAEYPITIESLSRFKTKTEQRKILKGLETGAVDLVVGTHRLVQPDIRFRDIGLLVIDEEQRFGVEAKEMLKQLRLSVDVLTLSATPIPRTLHMSLLGIRDISNLTTPPQDRVSIETRVCRWDGDLIRQAIVRELNRGGQIYFVHNRVYNIRSIADRLQAIVPEARIAIVHGQMGEGELEKNMIEFVRGKADILVATTIIESGLDIPNANTMFIHQADKYGLADLHQLRGRVGRFKHRAYCYLILEEGKTLSGTAAKRLKAIEEYSELGAGFKIAMRDLEIRGAGNILGTEQSGHIATVGYELYCQLLENAVRKLKGEKPRVFAHVNVDLPVTAFVPSSYVPPGRAKIDVYRKLSAAQSVEELAEVASELRDRFGPVPPEAEQLLSIRELQLLAFAWGIDNIHLEGGDAVFGYRDDQLIHTLAGRYRRKLRIVDRRNAYLLLPDKDLRGSPLVDYLKSVLRKT